LGHVQAGKPLAIHSRNDAPARTNVMPDEPAATSAAIPPQLNAVDCIQVLEIREGNRERRVTVTAAIAGDAIQAICTALSEQLDRCARDRTEHAEDVPGAHGPRRTAPAAGRRGGHAVVSFTRWV
jgi:hypothetical protein